MAEEITDESWQELMRREVFDPLEMRTAGFGAPAGDSAWPHRWDVSQNTAVNPVDPVADNPPSLGPAGTVHASIADWIRFLDVFIGGGPVGYLSEAILDDLMSPLTKSIRGNGANPDAAAGWFVVDRGWAGGIALNHAGSNTMNYALVWLAPAKRRGIAIATNGARPETAQILDGLAAWLVTRYISTID
jgi:D-alanyl-D-alanine carboxypeptidase